MVFLDASPVIYFIEQPPVWGQKAIARVAALRASGTPLYVTEIIRMECLVGPVKSRSTALMADFAAFFAAPDVNVLPITAAVSLRAATIRAINGFQPIDSLHLAAAVEHGCSAFLTNDARLRSFPDIPIEILA
jgi:uncharacterized protein